MITRPLQLVVTTVRVRVPRPRFALVSAIFFIFGVAYIMVKPDLPRIDLPHTQIYCSCFLPPGFTEYCISILRYFIISHLILVFCLHKSLISISLNPDLPQTSVLYLINTFLSLTHLPQVQCVLPMVTGDSGLAGLAALLTVARESSPENVFVITLRLATVETLVLGPPWSLTSVFSLIAMVRVPPFLLAQ